MSESCALLLPPDWALPPFLEHVRALLPECFDIEGPVKLALSGGESSALLLYLALVHHRGKLPSNWFALFGNTGAEDPVTYEFLERIVNMWGVELLVAELSRQPDLVACAAGSSLSQAMFRETTIAECSRLCEPFQTYVDLFDDLRPDLEHYPSPMARMCSSRMKQRPTQGLLVKAMARRGFRFDDEDVTGLIGLRHDEPQRIGQNKGRRSEGTWNQYPLDTLKIDVETKRAFWRWHHDRYGWGLGLGDGLGNCVLCPLKTVGTRLAVLRARPDDPRVRWFVDMEKGGRLWKAGQPLRTIEARARQLLLPGLPDRTYAERPPCECSD